MPWCIAWVDLQFLDNACRKKRKTKSRQTAARWDLSEKLMFVVENQFERITLYRAVDILVKSKAQP
jgi:hypothetical protein